MCLFVLEHIHFRGEMYLNRPYDGHLCVERREVTRQRVTLFGPPTGGHRDRGSCRQRVRSITRRLRVTSTEGQSDTGSQSLMNDVLFIVKRRRATATECHAGRGSHPLPADEGSRRQSLSRAAGGPRRTRNGMAVPSRNLYYYVSLANHV